MTTLDTRSPAPNRLGRFFTLYKPGQGKWVRWSTVAALAIIVILGARQIGYAEIADRDFYVQAIVISIVVLAGALFTFWFVNSPKLAEFMIMTESEMRKVSWPSRREVFTSTKIVIILTLLLGLLLCVVDEAFLKFVILVGLG